MKRIICILFLTALLNIFALTVAFSDQIATTEDKRKVRLRDDGTWEYMSGSKETAEFIQADGNLRIALRPYIASRDEAVTRFEIYVNWSHPSYEVKYEQVVDGLHRVSKRKDANKFRRELNSAFGLQTAEDILFIIDNWNLWEEHIVE